MDSVGAFQSSPLLLQPVFNLTKRSRKTNQSAFSGAQRVTGGPKVFSMSGSGWECWPGGSVVCKWRRGRNCEAAVDSLVL